MKLEVGMLVGTLAGRSFPTSSKRSRPGPPLGKEIPFFNKMRSRRLRLTGLSKNCARYFQILSAKDISIRPPEVVLVTESGDFILNAASGGITSIVELTAALIYACTLRPDIADGAFVVSIDEPENHLHPSLQRAYFQTSSRPSRRCNLLSQHTALRRFIF